MKHSPWTYIKYRCRILFCQLRRLGKICPFLSTAAANKLILRRLDHCNSLPAGLPDNKLNKLQYVYKIMQPWIVLHKPRHVSASSLLRTLHWLPVKLKAMIQYRIVCFFSLAFVNSFSVIILWHLIFLTFIHTIHLGHCTLLTPLCLQFLASASRPLTKDVFCPIVWNSLPLPLRKNKVFFNVQKEPENSLLWKHPSNDVCKCVLLSPGLCVCVCVCVCLCLCIHARVCRDRVDRQLPVNYQFWNRNTYKNLRGW